MTRHILLALGLVAAVSLQPLLNERSESFGATICLPLFVAAAALFCTEGSLTLLWAAAAGLVSDCLGPNPPGVEMLTTTLSVAAVRMLLGGRPAGNVPTIVLGSSVVVFCTMLLSLTARGVLQHTPADMRALLENSLRSTIACGGLIAAACIATNLLRRANPLGMLTKARSA